MALPIPPINPEQPIPNNPFYSPETFYIYGPLGPIIVGNGINIDYPLGTINATGGGSSGVSSIIAGVGIAVNTPTGNVTVTNTGVTSLIAGTGITISAATGAITISTNGTDTAYVPKAAYTAPGDILTATGPSTLFTLPVGTNGQVLVADSTCTGGLKWTSTVPVPSATPTVEGIVYGCSEAGKFGNTALGENALLASSDFAANVAIGTNSLSAATTGSFNTTIGYNTAATIVAGNYNTAIGYCVDFPADGNRQLAIGFNSDRWLTGVSDLAIKPGAGIIDRLNVCGYTNQVLSSNGSTDGPLGTVSITNPGSGYTDGVYPAVALTGGTGTGASATVTVASGAVSSIVITSPGSGYTVGDSLSVNPADLGGGAGLAASVTGIYNNAVQWVSVDQLINRATPVCNGVMYGCTGLLGDPSHNFNTALGQCANTPNDGYYNTVVGDRAAQFGASNNYGVFIGYCSKGNSPASGDENVFVGACTATDPTFNSRGNVGIGFQAGSALTTGQRNVFVGRRAGEEVTVGKFNTLVGHRAYAAANGQYNTALGSWAAANNGAYNISIGVCAPYNVDTTLSTNHNVAIGSYVCLPDPTISCQLIIGSGCYDTGSTSYTSFCWLTGCPSLAIRPTAGIIDRTGSCGSTGQVLASTGSPNGPIAQVTIGATGSGYTDGLYPGVVLTGGTGTGAIADITVASGAVSNVTITTTGTGYVIGDSLGVGPGDLGGGGVGFLADVTTIFNNAIEWVDPGGAPPATPIALGTVYACTLSGANSNTAVGYHAHCATPSGEGNVAVGTSASTNLGKGAYNTSVGWSALAGTVGGCANTAIGYSALSANGECNGNTAIGFGAGCLLTSGCSNTFLGTLAGGLNTAGSYNVAIGCGVGVPTDSADCQLAIGICTGFCWLTGCSDLAIKPGAGIIDCNNSCGFTNQVLTSVGSVPGAITAVRVVQGGLGYTSGTYTGVPLAGGTGSGALATVVVQSNIAFVGPIISVTVTTGGTGYTVGDTLTINAADVGGVGSGFSGRVTAVGTTNNILWQSPTAIINYATPSVAGKMHGCTSCENGTYYLNTALGVCANTNNQGRCVVSVGACSGPLVSTNDRCSVYMGFRAGRSCVSGCRNVAIGACAGADDLMVGCMNVFIGDKAGLEMTGTSHCNVAIGACSGCNYNTVGCCNVMLGTFAQVCGSAATPSNRNIAIGTCSGGGAMGCGNICIGSNAGNPLGYVCPTATLLNENLLIGHQAQWYDQTIGCQLVIGRSCTSFGTNNCYVLRPWLTGNPASDIRPGAGVIDCAGSAGTAGQVLLSTGPGSGAILGLGPLLAAGGVFFGGPFTGVPLNGGTGTGAIGTVTLNAGGGINEVFITTPGTGYTVDDVLTINPSDLGNPGGIAPTFRVAKTQGYAVEWGSVSAPPTAPATPGTFGTILGCIIGSGTSIGCSALANVAAGGGYNTAMGRSAMYATTTGSNNAAFGFGALGDNTTGCNNTAVGSSALTSNTIGRCNTAIGSGSLPGGSGVGNTAVGCGAAYATTNGICNVAVGLSALKCNTANSYNTAVGVNALFNTAADGNTAIGYHALRTNTSGALNVALGYQAGECITGNFNIAIGQCSLVCGTGNNNIAIGSSASLLNSSGSDVIAIGAIAGIYSTGSFNVFIGSQAACTSNGGSGNVIIGGQDSTGSYTPVYGLGLDNDRVAIGSSAVTNAYIAVPWTIVSDARDKIVEGPVPIGLEFVKQLEPKTYHRKKSRDGSDTHGPKQYGFLAQEVLALEGNDPVIIDANDPEKLYMTESRLIPVLVNAIKELAAKVEALEAKLNT